MPLFEGSLPGNPQVAGQYFSSSPYAPKGTLELTESGWIVARQAPAITYAAPAPPAPIATPVTPTFDPKLEANALYGKPMALFAGGFARIGAGPAPIVGPYINGDIVDFVVSFGVPANVEGDRKIYAIWLDNELAWSSTSGGTLPADGTFSGTPFDFVFKPGTLTQSAVSLEYEKFPGDENAYRPMMILEIRNLAWQRFMDNTGKPVPYVACDIGDTSDGVTTPQDGINLGLALQRVAFSPWCGYTSANFEAVNITDVVGAILIKNNFNFVQLCQSITGEYRNIDLLVSDKVWIKDRGSNVSPNYIFDRDKIIAGDGALAVARAGATAQRREHELTAIDPDQDYTAVPSLAKIPRDPMVISAAVGKDSRTIPLVIDADTRQALATFSQNYDENARRKINFKAPALAYEIEPGDMFAMSNIASGFDNEVFKTITTSHGANWMVEVEGEAILRCSIYAEPIGSGTTWDAATAHNVTLSGGDLIATCTAGSSTDQGARVADTVGKSSGKYYFEIKSSGIVGLLAQYVGVGIGTTTSSYVDMGAGRGVTGVMVYTNGTNNIWSNGVQVGGVGPTTIAHDEIGIAVDLDNRKIWFRRFYYDVPKSDWNGQTGENPSADPATNTGGITIPAGTMVPFCTFGGSLGFSGDQWTANFGASDFVGVVPAGFTSGW